LTENIIISAYNCDPYRGGESSSGWNYTFFNAKAGRTVYCITQAANRKQIESEMQKHKSLPAHFIYVNNPDWLRRYIPGMISMYVAYIIWQWRAYKAAKALLKKHPIDLIQHVSWSNISLGSFMYKTGVPLIFGPVGGGQTMSRELDSYIKDGLRKERIRDILLAIGLRLNPLSGKTLKQAVITLVTNQDTYDVAASKGAGRIAFLLDSGLQKSFYPPTFPKRPKRDCVRILFVGRLMSRKGIKLALDSLRDLSKSDFTFRIIGDGEDGTKLAGWIAEFDLQENVIWDGARDWEYVRNAYMESDIFLFCSLRDSFGSQLLEAMACGLPVVTLNQHGARDFVPDTAGIKVDINNKSQVIKDLRSGLDKLVRDKKLRDTMGKQGYEFALTQQWETKVSKIAEKYYDLNHSRK